MSSTSPCGASPQAVACRGSSCWRLARLALIGRDSALAVELVDAVTDERDVDPVDRALPRCLPRRMPCRVITTRSIGSSETCGMVRSPTTRSCSSLAVAWRRASTVPVTWRARWLPTRRRASAWSIPRRAPQSWRDGPTCSPAQDDRPRRCASWTLSARPRTPARTSSSSGRVEPGRAGADGRGR